MKSSVAVSRALAGRTLRNVVRIPGAVIPIVAMPVFILVAFSGSFSGVTDIPGFPTDTIQNWVMPFAVCQGAAFSGLGSAFGIARDLENGFYDRLLLAPVSRTSLLLGAVIAAMGRALVPVTAVFTVGLLSGARLTDGPLGAVFLAGAAMCVAGISSLWGVGVVYRLQSQRALGLVQVGIFTTMFLTVGQVPLSVMEGWLHAVARVNPMTNILGLARQGFLPAGITWEGTWGGLVAIAACFAVLGAFATRGMRRLVP